jgi:hypothetical protein
MKQKRVIVTEGEKDTQILKAILPDNVIENLDFITSSGYSSALSIARTLLINGNQKIALVIDSDEIEESALADKEDFINSYMQKVRSSNYKIFMFNPSIESFITNDKSILQDLMGKKLTELEWYKIKSEPKHRISYSDLTHSLLNKKNKTLRTKLIAEKPLKELVAYLK